MPSGKILTWGKGYSAKLSWSESQEPCEIE